MSKTIGIYAYIKSDLSIIGGIEAQVVHIAKELATQGCLASDTTGLIYEDKRLCFKSSLREYMSNVWLFIPKNGYGLKGSYKENVLISQKQKEDIIYCFGTRDGTVFEISLKVKY